MKEMNSRYSKIRQINAVIREVRHAIEDRNWGMLQRIYDSNIDLQDAIREEWKDMKYANEGDFVLWLKEKNLN